MKKLNAERVLETTASGSVLQAARDAERYALYVGLDVHKDTVAVSPAQPGRDEPRYWGEIANTPKAMEKLVNRLSRESGGAVLQWCYEAGPCGYVLYRPLLGLGQDC